MEMDDSAVRRTALLKPCIQRTAGLLCYRHVYPEQHPWLPERGESVEDPGLWVRTVRGGSEWRQPRHHQATTG